MDTDGRLLVLRQVLVATIDGDEWPASDVAAVIQTKIVSNAGKDDKIRILNCFTSVMSHLQMVFLAEQASSHATQINRNAQFGNRNGQRGCLLRLHHCP